LLLYVQIDRVPSVWLISAEQTERIRGKDSFNHASQPNLTSVLKEFFQLQEIFYCFCEYRSVCFYFCSTERNFELFSLPRNGSERNSESVLLFLFRGTEFWAFFSCGEWFGTEFREFSVPRNSRRKCENPIPHPPKTYYSHITRTVLDSITLYDIKLSLYVEKANKMLNGAKNLRLF
jgi:hypothetical protein